VNSSVKTRMADLVSRASDPNARSFGTVYEYALCVLLAFLYVVIGVLALTRDSVSTFTRVK